MGFALIFQQNVSHFSILNPFQIFFVVITSEAKGYKSYSKFKYLVQKQR